MEFKVLIKIKETVYAVFKNLKMNLQWKESNAEEYA